MKKRNSTLKPTDPTPPIDWAAVDAAPNADKPDDDSPELNAKHLVELQPFNLAFPASTKKTRISIMLDDAVLQAYKARAGGRGYQTLINETLRHGLETDAIKEALREVIREELNTT